MRVIFTGRFLVMGATAVELDCNIARHMGW